MKRLISILLVLFTFGVVYAQSDLQPIATVKIAKSEPITVKQLKVRAASVAIQNGLPSLSLEQKKLLLDEMINEKLLVQSAEKARMTITDTQVAIFKPLLPSC